MLKENGVYRNPLVSVIIPVYQAENYIITCVKSVLEQGYDPIKIYLVNDGSIDRSLDLCNKLARSDSRIKVVSQSNGGASSARNHGLSLVDSSSKYILFLDSDDELIKGSIAGLVELAEETSADIIMPYKYIKKSEENGKEDLAFLFPPKYKLSNPKEFAKRVMIKEGRAWRASALLYSYSIIKENCVTFPEGFTAEDFVFNLEVMEVANKIEFYDKPTLLNLKRKGSVSSTFQKDFEKTIIFLDRRARGFLEDNVNDSNEVDYFADALLLRNIIVYLFSIMSASDLQSSERKQLSKNLLNNRELLRDILNKKISSPYFNSRSVRMIMPLIYFLIRHGKIDLTIKILSVLIRKNN